jgi:aldehyde dehydrogenase (NAD+)
MAETTSSSVSERNVKVAWTTDMLIDGRLVSGVGAKIDVYDPATEEKLASVSSASSEQLEQAVEAASNALLNSEWRDPAFRKVCLLRLADIMERKSAELASIVVQDVGTPISITRALQVGFAISTLRDFATRCEIDRTVQLGRFGASESIVAYRPVGVVAAISAYNYPLVLACTKVGAALAAGCTTILVPSPQAPLAVLKFGELANEAGIPNGVVNVICGDADLSKLLTEHPKVAKVTFTGSVDVGRAVMQQAAKGIKDVVLELGGKSAAIVLPGADLESATAAIHPRYLRNAGQGCASPTRILVESDRFEEFLAISRSVYANIKVGDPWDPDVVVGPLISARHRARVEALVEESAAEGGIVVAGGGRPAIGKGFYMNPTLIAGVSNNTKIAREELFGPVGVAMPYSNVDEAVSIANDSDLGLHGYLYGFLDDCLKIAPRIEAGSVTINGGGVARTDAPIGGLKLSGIGREWGEFGVMEFLEAQHIQWVAA